MRVDGFEGRITDIRTRYTIIRALNGRESIVPNETLIDPAHYGVPGDEWQQLLQSAASGPRGRNFIRTLE